MGKLFGTDGIRGVVNAGLDADLAYKVGLAAAEVLASGKKAGEKPLVTIGKDTRISGDLLKGSLIAGLCTAGADVLDLGTLPTPGVAWVTVDEKADAGIVISASHNPFEHNGIKIFNGQGFKLSDELEEKIEEIVLFGHNDVPRKTHGEIGKVSYVAPKASEDYIDHLVSTIDTDLSGLKILVDCANGASSATAGRLFDSFSDLHTDIINADPDGVNINNGCGSTHLDSLKAMVTAGKYDLGIAFDGDADRCLMVDETGEEIDGDQVIAACGLDLLSKGQLPGSAIVGTVMSNLGLHVFCREHNMELFCTAVGDRNVLEKLDPGRRAVRPHHLPQVRHHRRRPAHRPAVPGPAPPLWQEGLPAGGGLQALPPDPHQRARGRQRRQAGHHERPRHHGRRGRAGEAAGRYRPGAGAPLGHRGPGPGHGGGPEPGRCRESCIPLGKCHKKSLRIPKYFFIIA